MAIEYDPAKAAANLKKHRVSFEDAAECLLDPLALVREDESAEGETRLVLLGMTLNGRLLVVCYTLRTEEYTLRTEETIRLISARAATRKEERQYAQGI